MFPVFKRFSFASTLLLYKLSIISGHGSSQNNVKTNLFNVRAVVLPALGKPTGIFITRVNEHLFRDKNSYIFMQAPQVFQKCQDNCDVSCFKIIDNATSFYQLKIKESFNIVRLKENNQYLAWRVARCIAY